MGFTSLLGIVLSIGFVLYGILYGGKLGDFYDLSSIFITVGGTLGALMVNFTLEEFVKAGKSFVKVFTYQKINMESLRDQIVDMAYISKKEGLLALEARMEETKDPFFKKCLMLVIDGTNPELTKKTIELEMDLYLQQDEMEQKFLAAASKLAPAFGMIGTLIGLIQMLNNLNDSSTIGPSMAVALVTTFYGAIIANAICIPMGGRLKNISIAGDLARQMIAEGILSIQSGETPFVIREKLEVYLDKGKRRRGKANEQETSRTT